MRQRLLENSGSTIKTTIEKDGDIYFEGVFALYDKKNLNDRVYPKSVMEIAIKEYNENYVATNRALGELEHQECVRDTAEILTSEGWKFINDISEDETVLTINTKTSNYEYQQIDKYITSDLDGHLIGFKGRNINTAVTPEHKFLTVDRKGKYKFINALELLTKNYPHNHIPKTGIWDSDDPEYFIIPGVKDEDLPYNMNHELRGRYTKPLKMKLDNFMQFMGIFLSDGNTVESSNVVVINQNKGKKYDKIVRLTKRLSDDLKWGYHRKSMSCSDARLSNYLKPLGNCYEKYIPEELKSFSPPMLSYLLNWYSIGDGRDFKKYKKVENRKNIFTVSRKLINDLQEILIKSGGSGNIRTIMTKKDYIFADVLIKNANKKPLYQLEFSSTKGIYLDKRFISIEKIPYKGKVYSVSVPNKTIILRENDKMFISGNSRNDVVLDRSAFVIKEPLVMKENGEIWGKAKILKSTPMGSIAYNLIKEGISIGVSSRGLGDVEERITESESVFEVVDYTLNCFDLVSQPSIGRFVEDSTKPSTGKVAESVKESKDLNLSELADILIG